MYTRIQLNLNIHRSFKFDKKDNFFKITIGERYEKKYFIDIFSCLVIIWC